MITLAAANTIQGIAGTASAITYTICGLELVGNVETYKVLAQGQLAASAGVLYTVPSSTTTFIKRMEFANVTASPVTGIILYINGTGSSNQIRPSLTIPTYGMLDRKSVV